MSRTPTGDTADLERQIGARGSTVCNSENRLNLRKWLTAQGVPSARALTLTLSEIAAAYNDTTNTELNKLTQKEPEAMTPAPAPAAAVAPDKAAALAALMSLMGGGNGITEERAKEIAAEAVANASLPRPVQVTVTTPTHTTTTTGHRHEAFETALRMVAINAKLALVGPAGSGKTTIAANVAEALGVKFLYTGAVDSPYKLTGFVDAQGRYVRTAFREAYEHGGLFLWDEVDASDPGALMAFNAALENGTADFPDGNIARHENFKVMAAANTYGTGASREYVGRNQLDAATLDRFTFLTVDYDEKLERLLAANDDWAKQIQKWRKAAAKLKIRHIISPRASITGARLLAAGLDRETVEQAAVWKGLDGETVQKIKGAA
jgi:midasin (ATPase involved in ribosome maturation)